MMHVGEQGDKSLSIYIENPDVLNIPRCTHDTPRCTHDIPSMYSWYPLNVLMVSPDVLNIPPCTEHTLYRVVLISGVLLYFLRLFLLFLSVG